MKYRNLRIAWSVAWGVVAVLLCVLWVRSYWYSDRLNGAIPSSTGLEVQTYSGRLAVSTFENAPTGWWLTTFKIEGDVARVFADLKKQSQLFNDSIPGAFSVTVPLWFTTFSVALIAVTPWLRWRFSLRTLLIATALVAVVLGMIVWMSRVG